MNGWCLLIVEADDKLIELAKQYKRQLRVSGVETREMKKRKLEERQERDRQLREERAKSRELADVNLG